MMLLGKTQDAWHVAGIAAVMHHQDGARPAGDGQLDRLIGDVQILLASDIHEHRRRTRIADRVCRCNERE